ncbi:NAD-dependent epimerase/dehydratase family protein [Hydrocarboniphaga effusa]|uniref:NAD-dependent epimerase/dehydratase family protein n=1 Tax=Hydrocarboniphaga effusa TaxID=243629 RepID=UPI00398C12EF
MRVLLLGGTGAMGSHLATLLANDGVEVAITSRTRSGESRKVRYLRGNAHDKNFLAEVLSEPWDAIVDFMVYNTPAFAARVQLLLESTAQYLFISSARVYADSATLITEDSPRLLDISSDKGFLATDEYALTKARQENILLASGRNNWTIIRPYITYGEERLQLGVLEKEGWLYRAMKGRTIVFSTDIAEKKTTLTYGLDVSQGIRAVIGQASALGEAFHITADHSLTWGKALSVYMDVLEEYSGRRPKVILRSMKEFEKTHSAQYQVRYDRLFNRVFDNKKIGRYVATSSFTEPEAGLRKCLKAFLAAPNFNNVGWRVEARKDKQTGESSLRDVSSMKGKIKYLLCRYILR